MRKILIALAFLVGCSISAFGQGNAVILSFPGVPSGNCAFVLLAINAATGDFYDCKAGAWNAVSGGSGSGTVTTFSGSGPSWLTWTVATPTTTPAVTLAPTTGQTSHQVIGTCNAATTFAPCLLVAGDLPSTAVTPGSYTATNITVDQQGRITAAANGSGAGSVFTGSTATNSTGITGTATNPIFSLSDQSVKSPVRFEPTALGANVASVTINNKTAGAKFSIVWLQDGTGGRTVTYGASATGTCVPNPTAGIATTQEFEVGADGTTVNGTGCTTTANDALRGPEEAAPGTPPASTFVCWGDSTNHILSCKENNSATVFNVVVPLTCTNQVFTGLSAGGVFTCATVAAASMVNAGVFTGDATSTFPAITIGAGAITSAKLNITTSTCTAPQVLTALSATAVGTCSTVPIPQNSQSAAYTTVLGDAGKQILHPTADNNARTFTIDSNANVAYAVGTVLTFINQINTVTIAITSDTLQLAGTATTGSRTLAAGGIATAIKVTTTLWYISGPGLT